MSDLESGRAPSAQLVTELVLCRHCDLLQQLPLLAIGQEAACSRCGYLLDMRQKDPVLRPVLYATSSLFMLFLANLFLLLAWTWLATCIS